MNEEHPPTTSHNYFKVFAEALTQDLIQRRIGVDNINFVHEEWCDFLNDRTKYCNCNPALQVFARPEDEEKERDGN